MFVLLTTARRLRAGRLLALIYLLCVLAPGLSFALNGDSPTAHSNVGMVHVHIHEPVQHLHKDGPLHVHFPVAHSHSGDAGQDSVLQSVAITETPAPDKVPHKSSDAKCCGQLCLSGLPANVIDIVKPAAPTSACSIENYRGVTDNAHARLYRPPIS